MLADNFPGREVVFDVMLRSENGDRSWTDMVPPEQRETLKVAVEAALDDWWETAPQGQKDKLNDVIATFKLPIKPKGKEWIDIKTWWIQLSNKEREMAVMTLFQVGDGIWALKDTNEFTELDQRITVLDQFPLFRDIPRDSLSADLGRLMDYTDEWGRSRIVHLRV